MRVLGTSTENLRLGRLSELEVVVVVVRLPLSLPCLAVCSLLHAAIDDMRISQVRIEALRNLEVGRWLRSTTNVVSSCQVRSIPDVHPLRRPQHDLRPPPAHHRPRPSSDDRQQPTALIVRQVTHLRPFNHAPSLRDDAHQMADATPQPCPSRHRVTQRLPCPATARRAIGRDGNDARYGTPHGRELSRVRSAL
jgi:hypothetical protein